MPSKLEVANDVQDLDDTIKISPLVDSGSDFIASDKDSDREVNEMETNEVELDETFDMEDDLKPENSTLETFKKSESEDTLGVSASIDADDGIVEKELHPLERVSIEMGECQSKVSVSEQGSTIVSYNSGTSEYVDNSQRVDHSHINSSTVDYTELDEEGIGSEAERDILTDILPIKEKTEIDLDLIHEEMLDETFD